MGLAQRSLQMSNLEKFWADLSAMTAESFRMDEMEKERLNQNSVAKMIGCLPFIAGTKTPERDGCSNLAVYIMSIRATKPLYNHSTHDDRDVLARLHDIMNFNGGDKAVIMKGMSLLALMMVNDYMRDREEDREAGKYNPINAGTWDFEQLRDKLMERYLAVESVDIDGIMTLAESGVLVWEPWLQKL